MLPLQGSINKMTDYVTHITYYHIFIQFIFQRVIIILHGEKPLKEDLDEDIQKYISSNTYIDSKDPWFWKKLR